jgi:hypothetical protein
MTTDIERRALASLALGRIFRMAARPEQEGDAQEYERCRSIIIDNIQGCPFPLADDQPYHGAPAQ